MPSDISDDERAPTGGGGGDPALSTTACIVTASDKTARVWELSDGAWVILHTLKGHMDEVRSVAVSPDGEHVVTGSADKTARQDLMESTMDALQQLRAELAKPAPEGSAVEASAEQARAGVAKWLGRAPRRDVERVGELLLSVRRADADRNGELSQAELATLSDADRAAWTARLALY